VLDREPLDDEADALAPRYADALARLADEATSH